MLRVCALGVVVGLLLGSTWSPWSVPRGGLKTDSGTRAVGNALHLERNEPIRVKPLVQPLIAIGEEERERLMRKVQPPMDEVASASTCYHLLRLYGLEGQFAHPKLRSGHGILRLLTDADAGAAYFGHPPVVRTRDGIRFPTVIGRGPIRDASLEAHRDQCLATLAELGIPLSYPVQVNGEVRQLRDALLDSIASFDLHQRELAWTGLAYALYLPPSRTWINRFGEEFSFDDLAIELLDRLMDQASCGGTHLLYTLTIIVRVDEESPILSSATRRRLWQHLQQVLNVAVATQDPRGFWFPDWNRRLAPVSKPNRPSPDRDSLQYRLLVTSHLAEWMLYLPQSLDPQHGVLERAAEWLLDELRNAAPDNINESFCPYTHAACVARQLSLVPGAHPHPHSIRWRHAGSTSGELSL